MLLTVLFVCVIFILAFAHFKGKYNQYYWKKRGVVFYEKHKTVGPLWEFIRSEKSLFQVFNEIYKKYENEPAVGFGSFLNQGLYVKDPINIQHVTQGDFQSFNDRGFTLSDHDLLTHNILFLHGPKWKLIRQKLTPLFTIAKLRNMFYIIDKSAQDFIDFLKLNPDRLKGDTYDTLTHYSCAAIAASVFGITTHNTFDSPFREMARTVLFPSFWSNIKFAINGISGSLYKALNLSIYAEKQDFFIGVMKQVIRQREKESVKKHDFIDMCVNLQKDGTMVDNETGLRLEPTDEILAAQAFFFFLAGVDPSAAGMFATLMELGRNPDVLKRVHEDVDALFEKYSNQLTYDAISEMKYLENVMNESLRLFPPIGILTRKCVKDSVLPVGNIPVEKDVVIFTPIYEIHHDPKYFPEPEKFDPERFAREGEINDMTYMPFGKGNRYCIGARFARIQVLTGVVHLLRNYTLKTYVNKDGVQFNKEQVQVRLKNVRVELTPRYK